MDLELFAEWRAEAEGPRKRRLLGQLIQQNEDLVKRVAVATLRRSAIPCCLEDLEQAGAIGVMRALEKFDPSRGSWSSYARQWLRHEMQTEVLRHGTVVRPAESGMPYSLFRKAEALVAKTGKDATAEDLGVEGDKLEEWRESIRMLYVSDVSGGPRDSGGEQVIKDDRVVGVEDLLDEKRVMDHIATWPEIDRAIVLETKTYKQIRKITGWPDDNTISAHKKKLIERLVTRFSSATSGHG